MPLDYDSLRTENKERYGWDIGRIGKQIFTDTYADRTHFILELLQNAEDAILRRGTEWEGPRTVSFDLTQRRLRISHFGSPFNEADVRGICGIADSGKAGDLTAIGRYGIGFKSVYAFTDQPEIHSGPEDFGIENFVWPKAAPQMDDKHPDETVFQLHLTSDDASGYDEISTGLRDLGSRTLLFLRHIEEIEWIVEGGGSGCYLRETKPVDDDVRRVTVIGQAAGKDEVAEEWLIFSRAVSHEGKPAGQVELAFKLDPESQRIQPIKEAAHLVVFFPTVLDTRLGFLIQGPYRTTPSRDNVPSGDLWNQHLVTETASLLQHALRWLRDKGQLDIDAINCLPLEPQHSGFFAPMFETTKKLLSSEPLLPRFGGGYTSAAHALLGRSRELRRLFTPSHLETIFDSDHELTWLSEDITQDRAPNIRSYLMEELNVREVIPEDIVRKLTRTFLESQSDEWIFALYEFLDGRSGSLLRHYLNDVPIVRLANGTHVTAKMSGMPQAFLPSDIQTGFPTVAISACASDAARSFLRSLGLHKPDLVDDVIQNLLPNYQGDTVCTADYEKDLERILRASKTDSSVQRSRLIGELRKTTFVLAIDARGNSSTRWSRPNEVYLPTDRLKALFDGVEKILFPDDSQKLLRTEDVHKLLEECGACKRLQTIDFTPEFTNEELRGMRVEKTGHSAATPWRGYAVKDWTLRGLDELLGQLSTIESCRSSEKAKSIWEELTELEHWTFSGIYTWFYYSEHNYRFDASFVEQLNNTAWVPDSNGDLMLPRNVMFDCLGWKEDAFLQSKIQFRPPALVQLAREAGIEPETIDLIQRHGLTTAKLQEWLRIETGSGNSRRAAAGNQSGQSGNSTSDGRGGDGSIPMERKEPETSFAKIFYEVQTVNPAGASDNPVLLPGGGPHTDESAVRHTRQSNLLGRSGQLVQKQVERWVPTEAADHLADQFRSMVHGDYGKRCQICGSSFMMPTSRELQVFVVHVVQPSADDRTNHFGDLLGLCGRHYALVRYGAWSLLDPRTERPFEHADRMRTSVLNAPITDIDGNLYVALPIQFANIFRDWSAKPTTISAEIHYSIPHWKYLRELLAT